MITIPITKRANVGKKACNELRGQGNIPAILYGLKKDVVALAIKPEDFLPVLQRQEKLVKFEVDGKEETAVIKEVQYNTYGDKVLHIDFCRIDMNKKLTVAIPIKFIGTPVGLTKGGVWEKTLRQLEISCLPINIPENIKVNAEHLDIGNVLRVKDIQLPALATLVTDPEVVACSVQLPKIQEAEPAAATTEATDKAEPEVIKKPKPEAAEKETKEKK